MDELDEIAGLEGLRGACRLGDHLLARDYLEGGITPDAECLRLSIRACHYGMECLKACLLALKKAGIPAGGFEDGEIPPLHLAARERADGGRFERYVVPLVAAGADPREKWRGMDAAEEAERRGHLRAASWLREISLAKDEEEAVREAAGG